MHPRLQSQSHPPLNASFNEQLPLPDIPSHIRVLVFCQSRVSSPPVAARRVLLQAIPLHLFGYCASTQPYLLDGSGSYRRVHIVAFPVPFSDIEQTGAITLESKRDPSISSAASLSQLRKFLDQSPFGFAKYTPSTSVTAIRSVDTLPSPRATIHDRRARSLTCSLASIQSAPCQPSPTQPPMAHQPTASRPRLVLRHSRC